MAESNDLAIGYAMGQDSNGGNNSGWGGAWEGIWGIIILAMVFGWGNNGFGGFGGGGGAQGAITRSDLCSEFAFNDLQGAVRGVSQGICDSTFALSNSINNGFHGVDNAICNLGFTTQQGFNATQMAMMQNQNALSTQLANCCCENRQGQADIKYQMATDTCAITTAMANNTRDIIDNQNANYRGLMDFMVQSKIDSLQAENQSLKLAASQASQNSAIGAMIAASEATILRRTGAECPSACYVVQPPTPVNFPVNGCGSFAGWNNGGYGCGNGCGSCC